MYSCALCLDKVGLHVHYSYMVRPQYSAKKNITAQPAIQTDWNTQNIRYISTTSETVHVFLWTVPSAVASLKVIERGPDYLVVKWTPPASPNGNVLSYRIEYKVGK